ncbi:hypothetical protein BC937DRAFT_86941 [Endogone sp. FLAS-F59071]|nr:hypothetical protein BC937DRAFT_86941 [Endogone sp. FLAS-F59071]|eukprot:RUS19772.1 hypothetical protein BC937DRAFT_86941 [Endogone sp. FLAS-F59071]
MLQNFFAIPIHADNNKNCLETPNSEIRKGFTIRAWRTPFRSSLNIRGATMASNVGKNNIDSIPSSINLTTPFSI